MKSILLKHFIISAGVAYAQFTNWFPDQVNTTICQIDSPRAALVRNKIYIDGGQVWWIPGYKNGTAGHSVDKGNLQGIIMSYDLSKSFDRDTNVTGILLDGKLSKARGGTGNANGDGPLFMDGALLANDNEFFLYGGALFAIEGLYKPPPPDDVLEYQAYSDRAEPAPLWKPSFISSRLTEGVTRYAVYGGSANAPSENKAWYFSGLTAPNKGPFVTNTGNDTQRASLLSDTFITLDMTTQGSEKWTNSTLPSHIKGRAGPEVVWVPVGEQGILVVLGGVTYPEFANWTHASPNPTLSEKESPIFMSTIDIYDVANNVWYQQPTTGGPGARTRGCAVVAPAADRSSFNIYYYGGSNGINATGYFYDDVWVLSLPSFTWTKISDGQPVHGRASHKCFLPYPDQMMVVGGYPAFNEASYPFLSCLQGGTIALLNLTSGEWMDGYNPEKYGAYGVPSKVQAAIGGNGGGHATATAPAPSGWATPELGQVFAKQYDVSKIKAHWPYKTSKDANETEAPLPPQPAPMGDQSKGVPNWLAPVLGVVLGLVVITGCLLVFCIWRRRLAARERPDTPASHEEMSERLFYWVKGHPQRKPTVMSTHSCSPVTETTRTSPTQDQDQAARHETTDTPVSAIDTSTGCHEMENTQIAELEDTSSPVELHGMGVTATDVALRQAGFKSTLTRFGSDRSHASVEAESPIAVSSLTGGGSEGGPSSPTHGGRWHSRKLSAISSVSFESGEGTNEPSIDGLVSPIGPTEHSDEDFAARVSPLKNVMNKNDSSTGV